MKHTLLQLWPLMSLHTGVAVIYFGAYSGSNTVVVPVKPFRSPSGLPRLPDLICKSDQRFPTTRAQLGLLHLNVMVRARILLASTLLSGAGLHTKAHWTITQLFKGSKGRN